MEIKLIKQEMKDIWDWCKRNPMLYENAPANKRGLTPEQIEEKKLTERFFGRCGELAVQKTFGGYFIKEGNGEYGGDWYKHTPTKPYDIKTQDTLNRTYPKLSMDLTEHQLNRYESNNIQGIIFCTAKFDLEKFFYNPIINIVAWSKLSDFKWSRAKPGKHSIDYSIYEGQYQWRTNFENLQ
tara:strand:+ start:44 stop:589 length:546 start_codon:yes stop_codon:yes gene_type:complete